MSRRVAVAGSRRWWRTRAPRTATSGGENPIRVAISTAIGSPTTLWSPGQPLPMSCSSAATSSRSGRSTSWVSSAAAAAASTRCRSTVNRCQGWRCGRDRTRSHSGSSRDSSPSWSSCSRTATAERPLASSRRKDHRSSAGHGSGTGGLCAASTLSVYGESRRSARAAAAAARSRSPGSAAGRAPWASTTSSPWRTTPSASGSRRIRRYRPRGCRTRVDSTRRHVSSATKASLRPARLTSRRRASSSASPSASATGRCSCRTRTSPGRPERRRSSSRTSSRKAYAASTSAAGSSPSWAAATARSTWPSRRPP